MLLKGGTSKDKGGWCAGAGMLSKHLLCRALSPTHHS